MSFDKNKESFHTPNHDKEKIFAAILKTLINMEQNTPISPKALVNSIVKHRGQATTTCSSHVHNNPIHHQLSVNVKHNRTFNPFQIKEIVIGNMQCYQLDDQDQIKVLRFIALTSHVEEQQTALKKGYINATHLRKAAIPVLGEGIFDTQKETMVIIITKGPLEGRGAWVPLYRARELIEEFEIESSVGLTKLLSDHPMDTPVISNSNHREKPVAIIPSRKHAKIAPSTKHLSTSEILKSMNIQALNLSALQHMMSVMPHLASQILPTPPIVVEKPQPTIPIVYPIHPTDPPMTITLLDNVAICIAILRKQQEEEEGKEIEYRLMRRLDTGFINGTQLLTAGGIETESERSMILSFEMSRIRILNKASPLYGTWIPCRRAQELAVTCSIQHKLGPFLDEEIESLFPSIPVVKRRQSVPIPTKEKQEKEKVLLTHPHQTLKIAEMNTQHAPLLGCFLSKEEEEKRCVMVIDPTLTVKQEFILEENDETDTDDDVEQVRKEMRRKRDAAIAAMAIGQEEEKFKQKKKSRHHHKKKETGGKWSAAKMMNETKSVIIIKKKDLKKKPAVTHTVVDEEDEDEDVDIGGSDNEDDLR